MRFKMALCQVLCLVTTVILQSVTAENDSISIELVNCKMQIRLEQNIMEKLEALLERRNNHVKQEKSCDYNSNIDTIEKFEQAMGKLQAQHNKVIEKLAAHTTTVQQMVESIKNLRNITDNLVANSSDAWKQLTGVKNESIERGNQSNINLTPSSCTTLNTNATGSYYIYPEGTQEPFLVFCDFENNYNLGGGWTVFQRRFDGEVDFYRNWTMYKNGFGDVNGEHWLGLEKLHAMTKSGRHELIIILGHHDGALGYALYDNFQIGSEAESYKLTVGSYSGTAGDSLGDRHNGMQFSTFDHENIYSPGCAKGYHGAWWFNNCMHSHLNGQYYRKGDHLNKGAEGLVWDSFKTMVVSLKSTKMMFRRRSE